MFFLLDTILEDDTVALITLFVIGAKALGHYVGHPILPGI